MLLSAETSYGVKMTCKFISPSLLFVTLTHLKYNAIRYTAGYVPRALKKKVAKSHHSNKKDLLCLDDLSMMILAHQLIGSVQ